MPERTLLYARISVDKTGEEVGVTCRGNAQHGAYRRHAGAGTVEERVTARKELAVVRRAADEPPPGTPESAKRRVARYYDGMQFLYSSLWSSSGVHYGFWEPGTRSRAQAIRNMDRLVACELALPLGSRVLDAGCGVGGTSMLLAEEHGLDVVGITISDDQLERARCAAAASPARARLRFAHADFLATGFEDASFDGVVGVESVCYAESVSRSSPRPGGSLGPVAVSSFSTASGSGRRSRLAMRATCVAS